MTPADVEGILMTAKVLLLGVVVVVAVLVVGALSFLHRDDGDDDGLR